MNKASSTKDEVEQITFIFTEGSDYRLIPVSGAYGGLTPQGLIWADLFIEHGQIPETITHQVTGSRLGKETRKTGSKEGHPHIERRREIGLVMTADTAEALVCT